jgi:hypothetical protein
VSENAQRRWIHPGFAVQRASIINSAYRLFKHSIGFPAAFAFLKLAGFMPRQALSSAFHVDSAPADAKMPLKEL